MKKLLCALLILVICSKSNIMAMAAESIESADKSMQEKELTEAYESIVAYAKTSNIPLDLSFDTFVQEYEISGYTDVSEYASLYYNILKTPVNTRSSSGSKWYYNTGTSLPQVADYSKYNLLSTVQKGDIIYESKGGFGITGHIAIVEGIYYSSTYNQSYIRVIEAVSNGVARGVLDDTRIDDKGVSILRVSGANITQKSSAVNFCISQLGKNYMIDFAKNTSADESDWYCSELVWAAYYNQGINIETTGWYNEPGITPRDINNSSKVTVIPFN